jgi:hypothetical protein
MLVALDKSGKEIVSVPELAIVTIAPADTPVGITTVAPVWVEVL